jgi:ATPase subunit of ABC transporter with duplicated ATPase domains
VDAPASTIFYYFLTAVDMLTCSRLFISVEELMTVLRLDNVTFSHPGGPLLENLIWAIEEKTKVGLVGPNGAGKSTILQLMAGRLAPDIGLIVSAKGVTVGYLPQK